MADEKRRECFQMSARIFAPSAYCATHAANPSCLTISLHFGAATSFSSSLRCAHTLPSHVCFRLIFFFFVFTANRSALISRQLFSQAHRYAAAAALHTDVGTWQLLFKTFTCQLTFSPTAPTFHGCIASGNPKQ